MKPALLIGGKSSRMGVNKSTLLREGLPLGLYLANMLERVTGQKPVLLGEGSIGEKTERFQCLPDPEKERGPLAGLIAFTEAFPEDDLLILPTDLYAMSQEALEWIISQAESQSNPVCWPKQPQRKHGEPLAAVYKKECFGLLQSAWLEGKGSPCQAITVDNRFEPLIPEKLRLAFVNINTPEELDAVDRFLNANERQEDRELLFPTSKKRAHHLQ